MKTILALLCIAAAEWSLLLGAVVFGLLTIGSSVGLMAAGAWLIATAAFHPPLYALSLAIVGVRFFGLARACSRYLERYISHAVAFRLLARIRESVYVRLEEMATGRVLSFRRAAWLERMITDVDNLQFFFLRVAIPLAVAILLVVAVMWHLQSIDFLLAVVFVIPLLVGAILPPGLLADAQEKALLGLAEDREKLKAILLDGLAGIEELTAFQLAAIYVRKMVAVNRRLTACQRRMAVHFAVSDGVGSLVTNGTVCLCLVVLAALADSRQIGAAGSIVALLVVQSAMEAIAPLFIMPYYLRESIAAGRRLAALSQDSPNASATCLEESGVLFTQYDLTVKNLSFGYGGDKVLQDISFSLPQGKKLAVVGPSGAGKSTLIQLLLRFWEYEGQIFLGTREIREADPETVRQAVGVVEQNPYLFHATIEENIRLARPDATEKELEESARQGGVLQFLGKLSQGYDTIVEQAGGNLSGGQCQRIALARAILKAAPILILDEPLTGLDNLTARQVLSNIYAEAADKSILLVTHVLQGLEQMDEILLLSEGRIVERGTLSELLARQGLFFAMWRIERDTFDDYSSE